MEFEKGKYYEIDFITNLKEHQHAILKKINKYQSVVISNFGGVKDYNEGNLVFFDCETPANVKRTFNSIHEVSERIKAIEADKEKENWPVKAGQIWEIKTKNNSCYFILIKDVLEKVGKNLNDYRCCVDVIHNHKTEGYSSSESYHLSPEYGNTTLLTKEQYEQRLKELEKPVFKKGDIVRYSNDGNIGIIIACNPNARRPYTVSWLDNGGTYKYSENELNRIKDTEVLKALTGKDYVLLKEGEDVYETKEIDQLIADSERLKVLEAQNQHDDHKTLLRHHEQLEGKYTILCLEQSKLEIKLQLMTENRDAWVRLYHDKKAENKTIQDNLEEDREKIRLLESKLKHLRAAKELQEKNHARKYASKKAMIDHLMNNFTNSIEDRLHLGKQLKEEKAKYLRLAKANRKLKKKYKKATSVNASVTPRITTEDMFEKIKGRGQDDAQKDTKDLF